MNGGLMAYKVGMTQIFTDDGDRVPVTVLDVANNRVCQIKTPEKDGYRAIQLAFGKAEKKVVSGSKYNTKMRHSLSKPAIGHFRKASIEGGKFLKEFPVLNVSDSDRPAVGDLISAETFLVGQYVDVKGRSIGKGFSGMIKRHNAKSGRASHGNSLSHNTPGSTGNCEYPGKVFRGKKMTGHLGNVYVTTQNLKVVKVDLERQLLFVKGAVPGSDGGLIFVYPSLKKMKVNRRIFSATTGESK